MKRKPKSTVSQIGATEFKARCLELLDDVQSSKRDLVITKRGKPVAKVVPIREEKPLFGFLKGAVVIHGDLTEPTDQDWEALKD